ncbi:MAG: hypothetical protein R3F27_04430 [Gammaproteobacteria bacterium]
MNEEFEKQLRQQLRASENGLDGPTLARLHAARNRALDAAGQRREWQLRGNWLKAAAAAGVAAIALFFGLRQPPGELPLSATELESTLLAAADGDEPATPVNGDQATVEGEAAETLDLLENLEFYEWLSREAAEEQQT